MKTPRAVSLGILFYPLDKWSRLWYNTGEHEIGSKRGFTK